MKISELIKELLKMQEKYGKNTEVMIDDHEKGHITLDEVFEMGDPIKVFITTK